MRDGDSLVVWDQKVETLLGCHRRAFEFFGGVPARIVIDNPKYAITKACYHDPEVQRAYAEIAWGYGFLISPCPPRDPQKKGIVESGVKYIKNNFLPLRDFRDIADANRPLLEWIMGTAGNRVHGTTRERPLTRFAEAERHFLRALPDVAPEVVTWAGVKLHGNCHVQFRRPSIPPRFSWCTSFFGCAPGKRPYRSSTASPWWPSIPGCAGREANPP